MRCGVLSPGINDVSRTIWKSLPGPQARPAGRPGPDRQVPRSRAVVGIGVAWKRGLSAAATPTPARKSRIKVMRGRSSPRPESMRLRFDREAKAIGALATARHVVKILDAGRADDAARCTSMTELLEVVRCAARSCPQLQPDAPAARVNMVMTGALTGLIAAHEMGIRPPRPRSPTTSSSRCSTGAPDPANCSTSGSRMSTPRSPAMGRGVQLHLKIRRR